MQNCKLRIFKMGMGGGRLVQIVVGGGGCTDFLSREMRQEGGYIN